MTIINTIRLYFIKLFELLKPILLFMYEKILRPFIEYMSKFLSFIGNRKILSIGILGLLLYVVAGYIVMFKYNYFGFTQFSFISNLLFFVFGFVFFFSLLFKYYSQAENIKPTFIHILKRLSLIIGGLCILFGLIYFTTNLMLFSNIVSVFLIITITIIGLYFVNKSINNIPIVKKIKNSSFFSLLYHFIFLIPTLIIDGSTEVYAQINVTPSYIFKILTAEILLILLYVLYPYISKAIFSHNSTLLLNEPKYLDTPNIIGTFENLHVKKNKFKFKYNYGISFWAFLDNVGKNSKENKFFNILSYGDKPSITFNPNTHILRVTTIEGVNETKIVYETKNIQLQKWNHFVVNYDGGHTDLFLNGVLVASKSGIIPYMKYDTITIGEENGMRGGICNVHYYPEPIPKTQIDLEYSFNENKTPPII